MSLFRVIYTYTEDVATRDEVRPQHRAYLTELADQGIVVLSGPVAAADGRPDGALLLVNAADEVTVRAHLGRDPFQRAGLVAAADVRGWTPVLGSWHAAVADSA